MSDVSFEDKVTNNRSLPVTDAKSIPAPDSRYTPTDPEKRAARLKKVAKNLEEELLGALQECAALGAEMQDTLGEFAPPAEKAGPLAEDIATVLAALTRVQELEAYLEEKKAILLNDGRAYIDAVKREYDHRAGRKPGLVSTFRKTVQFSKAIGEAISEGIAEAKAKKKSEE